MRPPPRSTLFPYTTLFRSAVSLPCHLARETPLYSCRCICIIVHIISLQCNSTFPLRGLLTGHKGRHIAKRDLVDRKSTRLNSSHVRISYAVFCLKKKKQQI